MKAYLDGHNAPFDSVGKQRFIATDGSSHAWPLTNVWIGVSIEDQASADERVPLLLDTPARETPGTPHKPVITTGFLLAAWVLRKPV